MKKIIFPIVIIALLTSCGESNVEGLSTDIIDNPITAGSTSIDDAKLPRFEFVDEVKDFGEITQGEVVSTTFRFRNVGQSDLIISAARASCGCTVPEWSKEPIKPGAEGKIDVRIDSDGKRGMQNKTIRLVANTKPNTMTIALKWTILVPEVK